MKNVTMVISDIYFDLEYPKSSFLLEKLNKNGLKILNKILYPRDIRNNHCHVLHLPLIYLYLAQLKLRVIKPRRSIALISRTR